ncbi:tail fiber domain-containing protein [Sinorhizobium medicae]|uniref:tail fiber domain-containing protein n=1 Tax=Sinorhizobium medicae TaxID=110321 RepID=UPI001294C899|nr:tail fiber domain-containing protein [Sinorhizobium medicae]MQX50083.1 tail fiber domain-containing protein [Sinorhizobium medicae]
MGLYGSAPEAPDPKQTASAQTATNIGTAVANNVMGNANQVTPDGNLTYTYNTQKWTDPLSGKEYDLKVPTATQTLSPAQQAIKDQEDAAQLNLATLANTQSGKLNGLLASKFDISGAPAAGKSDAIGLPQYQSFTSGPKLQTSLANAGNVQSSIAGAGSIQSQVADSGKIQTSLGNAGNITESYDFDIDTSKYEQALMDRLSPQIERDRAALETKLTNQGLQPGSEAYDRAMDEANRAANDARIGATLSAGQEQSRIAGLAQNQAQFQNSAQQQAYDQMAGLAQFYNSAQAQQYAQNANDMQMGNAAQQQQFSRNQAQMQANNAGQEQKFNQGLTAAQFGNDALQQQYQNQNTATGGNNALADQRFNSQQAKYNLQNQERAQYLNELYAQRNQPINEIVGLMSGAQVDSPSFVPTQSNPMPTVDYAGLVQQDYANKMGAYQQKQSTMQNLFGGMLGFGGQLASLSDKRAKKDIKKVGGLYEYRYKGEGRNAPKRIGVMAQEVEKVRPDAVAKGADGLRRVDYGLLFNAGRGK